jgi:hypothetical protein
MFWRLFGAFGGLLVTTVGLLGLGLERKAEQKKATAEKKAAPGTAVAEKSGQSGKGADWLTTSSERFQMLMRKLAERAAPPDAKAEAKQQPQAVVKKEEPKEPLPGPKAGGTAPVAEKAKSPEQATEEDFGAAAERGAVDRCTCSVSACPHAIPARHRRPAVGSSGRQRLEVSPAGIRALRNLQRRDARSDARPRATPCRLLRYKRGSRRVLQSSGSAHEADGRAATM